MIVDFPIPSWLPKEVKDIAIALRENSDDPFRVRLLVDVRMREVWSKFKNIEASSKRENGIKLFLQSAPEFLGQGKALKNTKEQQDEWKTILAGEMKVVETRKIVEKLRGSSMSTPEDYLRVTESLDTLESWLSRCSAPYVFKSDNSKFLFGEEYACLKDLKYSGRSDFDETYTFVALGILLRKIFGQGFDALNGITVMVMKNTPHENYDTEDLRSRVNKAVKRATREKPSSSKKKVPGKSS